MCRFMRFLVRLDRLNCVSPIRHWGKAEVVKYPPADGGTLAGRKGVILFEVSGWSNAEGHATLFDGRACYDHCYFNAPEANYRTDRAHFWSLP
jgi:hypothetical protein